MSLEDLANALGGNIHRNSVLAPGPGHSARDRSLSVKPAAEARDGFICYSFAGDPMGVCRDYVRDKLAHPSSFYGPPHRRKIAADNLGEIVATYDYVDADGVLLYQVVRYRPKAFSQRCPNGRGGWIGNLNGVERVLYRLPELLSFPYATVFICEGEKDADRVAALGHCATSVAAWTPGIIQGLAGRDVLIMQDNDEAGRKKALEAARALRGTARSIRIVALPGLGEGEDVSDWLDRNAASDLAAVSLGEASCLIE